MAVHYKQDTKQVGMLMERRKSKSIVPPTPDPALYDILDSDWPRVCAHQYLINELIHE